MTTEKAIKYLELYVGNDCYTTKMQTACKMAITALRAQQKAEQQGPCSRCVYGGKHLNAPPCTICPAYPRETENNAPPSANADRIRAMSDEELAGWLCGLLDCRVCEYWFQKINPPHCDAACPEEGKYILKWLQQPAEEG